MPKETQKFSVRKFLRQREALLVHFSGFMTRHEEFRFPDDLKNAMTLKNVGLAFSTVQIGDSGVVLTHDAPNEENATGSVGIVVDIPQNECVRAVSASDAGSHLDGKTGKTISDGEFPTEETCAQSIDLRTSYNEWIVENYNTIGIFLFQPTFVLREQIVCGDTVVVPAEINVCEVANSFPDQRLFSLDEVFFREFDRMTMQWRKVLYTDIISNG